MKSLKVFSIAIFLLFLFFSNSCSHKNKGIDCNDIIRITINYLPKGIDPAIPISDCNYIFYYTPVLKEITLYEQGNICQLVFFINNFKTSNENTFLDFRININLENKDGEINRLCLGEDDLIVFNGVLMKNEMELFEFINKLLY